MTISYDKQVLIKRGNTASVSTYVGPLGELVLNTDTNRVFVHNGVTAGGTLVGDGAAIAALIANAAAQSAQIGQLQTDITTANTSMKGYVDNSISSNIAAIIGGAPGALDTLNELANALGNNASFSTTITNSLASLTSNAAVQAGLIADTNTAITTANLAMKGYVDSEVSTLTSNAAVQAGLIADTNTAIVTANVAMKGYVDSQSFYSNAKVAAYLPTYTGNISATVEGFAIGYKEVPQVAAGNVTLVLSDSGKHYYSSAATPTTLTIPSNANVAFPIGTAISIVNAGTGNITIGKQAEASLYLAGNTTNATRTLTSYGMATVLKTATNQWFINGTGLE